MSTSAADSAQLQGFWSVPMSGRIAKWWTSWDRLVDRVGDSDALTLYRAVEEGVPSEIVAVVSKALAVPASTILRILGLPESTFRRKAQLGEPLPDVAAHRLVALLRVVATLRQMLAASGDADRVKSFDLEHWVALWISEQVPALEGLTPAALLRNPDGQRVVEVLLERMRGGLVA